MKKIPFYFLFLFFFISAPCLAADSKTFHGSGEVVTVDPLYSRLTIETGAIKGFSGGGKNEFVVSSQDLLKDLSARDLVEFDISGSGGEAKINRIKKVGVAPEKDSSTPIGKVAQDILIGTGQVVKTITTPIPPVHDTVGEAVGATTEAAGNAVSEAKSDVKRDF